MYTGCGESKFLDAISSNFRGGMTDVHGVIFDPAGPPNFLVPCFRASKRYDLAFRDGYSLVNRSAVDLIELGWLCIFFSPQRCGCQHDEAFDIIQRTLNRC